MTTAIEKLVDSLGSGPVFVHSDPFRAARMVKPVRDRNAYLDAHIDVLCHAACDRSLWVPTFNYDFPKTGLYDVRESESQLGPIPELAMILSRDGVLRRIPSVRNRFLQSS